MLAPLAGLVALLFAGAVRAQEPPLLPAAYTTYQPAPCVCPPPAAPVLPAYTPPPPATCAPLPLFALQAMLGQELGIRGQLAVDVGQNEAIVAEGFYGWLYNHLGSAEAFAAGSRFLIRNPWPDCIDGIVLGPGIDVFFLVNHNEMILLTPSLDVGYLHNLGGRLEAEIGLDVGLAIGVSGHTKSGNSAAGEVTTLVSFYVGIRF
jgi:hypothetical protein